MTNFQVDRIAADAGTKSCRRPLKAGLYDATSEKTFVTWLGENCSAVVAAYYHSTGEWTQPKRVGESFEDHHNYPHLVQTADGHLHIFYGCHNTPLKRTRSPMPHTIEGDWQDGFIEKAPAASYPMPVVADSGDVFVFYRQSNEVDDRPILYIRSQDNGQSWENSKTLTEEPIALGHEDRADNLDEIYIGQLRHEPGTATIQERIHFVWTLAGGGREGRSHDRYHRNVYYAWFSPDELRFYSVTRRSLGHWLDREASENHCLVHDTGQPDGHDVDYIQHVHTTASGEPVLAYDTPSERLVAVWTGSDWNQSAIPVSEVDGGPNAIFDIERTGAESFTLYVSNPDGLERMDSNDGGQTWQREGTIETSSPLRHAILIDNYRDPIRLLATEATDWDSFRPNRDMYAIGRHS